jgi:hypothetical protein
MRDKISTSDELNFVIEQSTKAKPKDVKRVDINCEHVSELIKSFSESYTETEKKLEALINQCLGK